MAANIGGGQLKEKSGIQIRQYRIQSRQQKRERSVASLLLAFLCLWMAVFGIFLGIVETFGVSIHTLQYLCIFFGVCIFWSGILQIKRWFGVFFVCSIVFYLYIFYQMWDRAIGGGIQIYNAIIRQVNQYYQLQLGMVQMENIAVGDILWTLGLISFLPAGILAVGTIKQSKPILIAVVEAVPILLALMLGVVVPLIPSMAMAFALFGSIWLSNLTMRKKKKRNKEQRQIVYPLTSNVITQTCISFFVIFSLAASIAVAFSNRILEPKLRKFDYVRVNIQNSTMEDLWIELTEELTNKLDWLFPSNPVQSGGISGGKLGQIGEWKNQGKVHLKVYSNKEIPYRLYLKAYVGSYYENNQWKPLEDYPNFPGEEIQSMGWERIRGHFTSFSSLPYQIEDVVIESNITIDNVGASSLYSYIPYYSNVSEFQPDIMDATIQKQGRGSRTYDVKVSPKTYLEWMFVSGSENFVEGQDKEWESEYKNWVQEHYLQIPENGIDRIKSNLQEAIEMSQELVNSEDSLAFSVAMVREFLNTQAVYSTNPGVTPSGEDFNEYFLYEQKKGLCMHFASAATIVFRLFGVPARYVEGYIVPQVLANRPNEVLDSYAHAWVEVWSDELGWVPIEVTPGYENEFDGVVSQPESSSVEESIEETTEELTQSETEEPTTAEKVNDAVDTPEEKANSSKFFPVLTWGMLIIAAIGSFIGLRLWRKKRLKRIFTEEKRSAIAAIAAAIRKIQQVSCQTWQDCQIAEEEMKWFDQLALKARFSKHFIDRRDVQKAEEIYCNLADQILARSNFWVRFKIKWIYCLR